MSRYQVSLAVVGQPDVVVLVEVDADLRATAVTTAISKLKGLLVPGTRLELETIREMA